MPTRVFIPPTAKQTTPHGSPRSIQDETPRAVVAAAPAEKRLQQQNNLSLGASAKTRKENEEFQAKGEKGVIASRIATTKPSASRRAITDPLLAPKQSHTLSEFPKNAARASKASHKMAREQEEVKRAAMRKYDLAVPLAARQEHKPAGVSPEKAESKVSTYSVTDLAAIKLKNESDDYAVTYSKFQQSLKATCEQLFFVEPPHEKKLFYWENHVAPMELMAPVAVDAYSKLNRACGWKSSMQKHDENILSVRHANRKSLERAGGGENKPSNIFEESDAGVYPEHIVIKTRSLGAVRNAYQETIPSVFDAYGR